MGLGKLKTSTAGASCVCLYRLYGAFSQKALVCTHRVAAVFRHSAWHSALFVIDSAPLSGRLAFLWFCIWAISLLLEF